jgi:hypothetical protein
MQSERDLLACFTACRDDNDLTRLTLYFLLDCYNIFSSLQTNTAVHRDLHSLGGAIVAASSRIVVLAARAVCSA